MSRHRFSATTFAVSHIANILRSVLPINNHVLVSIDNDGIRFMTEYAHVCRIDLTLEKTLFTTYDYYPDEEEEVPTNFTIDLTPIVESLSLAQSSTYSMGTGTNNQLNTVQCTISYQGENSPFVLIFEDSKISERCEFSTFLNLELSHLIKPISANTRHETEGEDESRDAFEIDQNSVKLECIIASDVFFDALKDLKDLETEEVYFYFKNQQDYDNDDPDRLDRLFAIISKSMMGNSLLSLPNEISILERLIINNNSSNVKNDSLSVFKFSIFQMCFKAVKLSNKCKIQKDSNHLLNLNLLCFKNESGSILPKNYSGTVINFKIFETSLERDERSSIVKFIEKSLKLGEKYSRNPVSHQATNTVQTVQPSLIQESGIDVPVFL